MESLWDVLIMGQVPSFLGDFSVASAFKQRRKYVAMDAITYDDPYSYNVAVSWGHKGFFVEIGCKNIFEGNGYKKE